MIVKEFTEGNQQDKQQKNSLTLVELIRLYGNVMHATRKCYEEKKFAVFWPLSATFLYIEPQNKRKISRSLSID